MVNSCNYQTIVCFYIVIYIIYIHGRVLKLKYLQLGFFRIAFLHRPLCKQTWRSVRRLGSRFSSFWSLGRACGLSVSDIQMCKPSVTFSDTRNHQFPLSYIQSELSLVFRKSLHTVLFRIQPHIHRMPIFGIDYVLIRRILNATWSINSLSFVHSSFRSCTTVHT